MNIQKPLNLFLMESTVCMIIDFYEDSWKDYTAKTIDGKGIFISHHACSFSSKHLIPLQKMLILGSLQLFSHRDIF